MKKDGHFGYLGGVRSVLKWRCQAAASAWPEHPHQLPHHIKAGGSEASGAKVTGLPPTTTLLSITTLDKDTTPLGGTEMGEIRGPECPQPAPCAEREKIKLPSTFQFPNGHRGGEKNRSQSSVLIRSTQIPECSSLDWVNWAKHRAEHN